MSLVAYSDEIEKLAIPKWKRMLLEGGLSRGTRKRLQPLLVESQHKQIPGLRKGTEAIIGKGGYSIHEEKHPLVGTLKKLYRMAKGDVSQRRMTQVVMPRITKRSGGGATQPALQAIGLRPGKTIFHKGIPKRHSKALDEIVLRHEADELRAVQALAKSKKPLGRFIPSVKARGLKRLDTIGAPTVKRLYEKGAIPAAIGGAGRVIKRVSKKLPKGRIQKGLKETSKELKERASDVREYLEGARGTPGYKHLQLLAKGRVPTGQHMDPSVLIRESRTAALAPKGVRKALQKVREGTGEAKLFRQAGYPYGERVPTRAGDVAKLRTSLRSLSEKF